MRCLILLSTPLCLVRCQQNTTRISSSIHTCRCVHLSAAPFLLFMWHVVTTSVVRKCVTSFITLFYSTQLLRFSAECAHSSTDSSSARADTAGRSWNVRGTAVMDLCRSSSTVSLCKSLAARARTNSVRIYFRCVVCKRG